MANQDLRTFLKQAEEKSPKESKGIQKDRMKIQRKYEYGN